MNQKDDINPELYGLWTRRQLERMDGAFLNAMAREKRGENNSVPKTTSGRFVYSGPGGADSGGVEPCPTV